MSDQPSPNAHDQLPGSGATGALAGGMLAGVFGLAWAQWGAAGLGGSAAVMTRVAGIAVGVLISDMRAWAGLP